MKQSYFASRKIIFLTGLSSALEFYDFILFIFLAKPLSKLFFPIDSAVTSLIYTYAIFAIGYIIRPIGGMFFGHLGDKYGRKTTFIYTLLLMGIPTCLIGLLPTYQTAGLWAPYLLLFCRILQGFAVGGELPGALTFLVETYHQQRGLICGLCFLGVNIGLISGSFISTLVLHSSYASAWRLAFILGGAVSIISYYLRKQLQETPLFKPLSYKINAPLLNLLKFYPKETLIGILVATSTAGIFNIIYLYLPTYLATYFHQPLESLMPFTSFLMALFLLINLALSYLSDTVGRKIILNTSAILFIFFTYPLFKLFSSESLNLNLICMLIGALFSSGLAAIFPSFLTELFPTKIRFTAVALCYNIGFGIFNGLTPLIITWLIEKTHQLTIPAFYIMLLASITFIVLKFTNETAMEPLKD